MGDSQLRHSDEGDGVLMTLQKSASAPALTTPDWPGRKSPITVRLVRVIRSDHSPTAIPDAEAALS